MKLFIFVETNRSSVIKNWFGGSIRRWTNINVIGKWEDEKIIFRNRVTKKVVKLKNLINY